jgi:hypothetical protein
LTWTFLSLQGFAIGEFTSFTLDWLTVEFLIRFLSIALGYLYSAVSLNLIRPENARGVLAAACLLGGMDDLCGYAYDACRQSLSVDTINEWLQFIDSIPGRPSTSGTATPDGSMPTLTPTATVFGYFVERLRDDVFEFLVATLPIALNVQQHQHSAGSSSNGSDSPSMETVASSGRDTLLQVFSHVPFDLFKAAIESPTFQIGKLHFFRDQFLCWAIYFSL